MTNIKKDNNQVAGILGALNSDGETPTPVKANPANRRMSIDDNTTGSDLSGDNAVRDDNGNTGLMAISETDGKTPVPLYVTSAGLLLVDSM